MYTNRGFLNRSYGNNQFQKPHLERPMPKPVMRLSPTSHLSPSSYSTKNFIKKPDPLLAYNSKSHSNIFATHSNNRVHEISQIKSYMPRALQQEYLGKSANFSSDHSGLSSPKALEKMLAPKDNHLSYSIFEIFGVGYSYTTMTGYGSPLGMGFLITKSLALTASSVIPDEDMAARCFARFTDNVYETHSFDANSFFFTNKELNFTVIGFVVSPESRKPRIPLEFREDFVLQDGNLISYLNSGKIPRYATGISSDFFSYTAGNYIAPGMPIFTADWHLQGIHHTCTTTYRFNQATRIDAIIKSILTVRSVATHPELDLLLTDYYTNFTKEEIGLDDGRYVYWVEWYNCNIYRYDIPLERWNRIKIANLSEFLKNESSDWCFNWGSRIAYLDTKIYIVGGVGHEISSTKSDFYEFSTETKEIFRKKDMLERREGPAIITTQTYVYVMGGKYSYTTCEKYSIAYNNWEKIAPMKYGRYEPVAVMMCNEKFIIVVGGFPQELVSKNMEKYDVINDKWEELSLNLPFPTIHPAIFPISHKKFALLGGKFSKSVIVVEIIEESLNASTSTGFFALREIDNLNDQIETVYPVVFYKPENKIFLIKSQEGASPQISYYLYKNLTKSSGESTQEHKKTIKLPPLVSKPNALNY